MASVKGLRNDGFGEGKWREEGGGGGGKLYIERGRATKTKCAERMCLYSKLNAYITIIL